MDATSLSLDEIIKKKKSASGGGGVGIKRRTSNGIGARRPTKQILNTKSRKIIKKGGVGGGRSIGGGGGPGIVIDARNKIIQKNRLKIRDARDKLAEIAKQSGDARLKILKKKGTKNGGPVGLISGSAASGGGGGHGNGRLSNNSEYLKHRTTSSFLTQRQHQKSRPVYVPPSVFYLPNDRHRGGGGGGGGGGMDVDEHMEDDFMPSPLALRRTVKNDMAYSKMPPLPTFHQRPMGGGGGGGNGSRSFNIRNATTPPPPQPAGLNIWNSDPFDCYEVPVARPIDVSEPKNLQRQIRNINSSDMIPRKGILRSSRQSLTPPPMSMSSHHHKQYDHSLPQQYQPQQHHQLHHHHQQQQHHEHDENSHLSYEMRARLERPPDSNVSMGIFSNPYKSKAPSRNVAVNHGYRIVVSNLHNSVSQSDIKELFEDIGELLEARLVRPGVAEVIFSTMKDAEAAVETYHNRQLDGQPMKCLLVNPRSSSKPTAPAIKVARSGNGGGINSNSSIQSQNKASRFAQGIEVDALHKALFGQTTTHSQLKMKY